MTTALGKELRKLRIDRDERLLDMAERLGKSASFVSAIEVGKKSPPSRFEEAVIRAYGLADQAAKALQDAADVSRKAFVIEPEDDLGRQTVGLLARRMNSLSEKQLREIQSVLRRTGTK